MLIDDMTHPYNAIESFVYDFMIADSVAKYIRDFDDEFISQIPSNSKVLDVGCGGAQIAKAVLAQREDIQLTGLDLSKQQITRAKKRCKIFSDRVDFVEGSALELPFENESFDIVYSIASIKHWPDPGLGLSECCRVLKPGGRILIVEADRGCTWSSAGNFVKDWKIPALFEPLALLIFRSLVAGRSLDIRDVHALLEPLAFTSYEVDRLPRVPAWLLNVWK